MDLHTTRELILGDENEGDEGEAARANVSAIALSNCGCGRRLKR
jgi:hypothetical protein